MSANIPQEHRIGSWLRPQWRAPALLNVPVLLCALAYLAWPLATPEHLADSREFAGYWLPNALWLASLLSNPKGRWRQLSAVSVAHMIPLLAWDVSIDRILGSWLGNEGLVLCAATVLRPLLERRASLQCGLSRGNAPVAHAIGGALALVAGAGLLVSLGEAISIIPAAGVLVDRGLVTCIIESILGFATVTPAVVCWSRLARSRMTTRWLLEVVLATSMAALVCLAAELQGGAIGVTVLCLLPLIALWAGLCLSAEALTGCLLAATLVLQFPERPLPGADGHEVHLFLFATAAGALAILDLRIWSSARLDRLSRRLHQATKRAERAYIRSRSKSRRQKLMLHAVDAATFFWDVRRDALWWNPGASRYLGERMRIRSGWLVWEECIDPLERAAVLLELQQFMESKRVFWERELKIKAPGGIATAVNCRASVIRDGLGRPAQMIGALIDMTCAREAQDSSRALARATRLAAIGEMAATITHEVNQPLAAILNNVETALYLMKAGRSSPQIIEEILQDIRSDDLRASEVVRRTRTLLQDRELVRRPVDLNDVVVNAVRLLSESARRRGIRVIVTCVRLDPVHADSLHLQQVMLNLVGNAFDAVEKAGLGNKRVEVSTRVRPGYAQVCVTDFGCGIPEPDLERIFEAFRTGKAQGLGLGLSLARFIVTAHGGRIFAENNSAGRGATICFELPLTVGSAAGRAVTSLS